MDISGNRINSECVENFGKVLPKNATSFYFEWSGDN